MFTIDVRCSVKVVWPQWLLVSCSRLTSDAKKRQYEGVRVMWNNGEEPTISQRWSASTRSMPWQTFTFHPLFTNALIPHYFDVKNFLSMLVTAVNEAYTRHDIGKPPYQSHLPPPPPVPSPPPTRLRICHRVMNLKFLVYFPKNDPRWYFPVRRICRCPSLAPLLAAVAVRTCPHYL